MIKRSAFYTHYKISGAEPVTVDKHRVPISTFINTVTEFLDTEFAGLIDIECKPFWDINSCIRICEDFTAYFFKNLLAAIYGHKAVSMEMSLSDDTFSLMIRSSGELEIDCDDMSELLRIAKTAGFNYDLSDTELTLSTRALRYNQTSVRSLSQNILRARFVKIFFTGGPMPDFALE